MVFVTGRRRPHRPKYSLSFTRRLLRWYRAIGRDLPWRRTSDPYKILVSEVMLQQTQVTRVEEYYPRFLHRYPTLDALSRATPAQVRASWDGLGYYRRAANLHRLAKTVMREHQGQLPDTPDALRKLPGIGTYTAGAITTFAYRKRAAAVDTNVERVMRRVFLPRLGAGAAAQRRIYALLDIILPARRDTAWEFNQALMDLGATVCVARAPRCGVCPVRPACTTGRRTSKNRNAL